MSVDYPGEASVTAAMPPSREFRRQSTKARDALLQVGISLAEGLVDAMAGAERDEHLDQIAQTAADLAQVQAMAARLHRLAAE